MRSRTLSIVNFSVGLGLVSLAACATPTAKATCYPVSGWSTPVFRCAAPPAPVVVAPPPPPPAPAEPELPAQTAEVKSEKIELSETVQFETDSAVLLDRSKTLLDEVVKAMTDHPEVKHVLIEGYTDSSSSRDHNQKLSEQRVASVRTYLVEKGIEPARLKTKGFGETHPVADNKTEEGRAQNRRVEFRILKR
jgi:outer membrane protein OmpA-like peptidoglycan-associated protein